jgi:hypothetical protein
MIAHLARVWGLWSVEAEHSAALARTYGHSSRTRAVAGTCPLSRRGETRGRCLPARTIDGVPDWWWKLMTLPLPSPREPLVRRGRPASPFDLARRRQVPRIKGARAEVRVGPHQRPTPQPKGLCLDGACDPRPVRRVAAMRRLQAAHSRPRRRSLKRVTPAGAPRQVGRRVCDSGLKATRALRGRGRRAPTPPCFKPPAG